MSYFEKKLNMQNINTKKCNDLFFSDFNGFNDSLLIIPPI